MLSNITIMILSVLVPIFFMLGFKEGSRKEPEVKKPTIAEKKNIRKANKIIQKNADYYAAVEKNMEIYDGTSKGQEKIKC